MKSKVSLLPALLVLALGFLAGCDIGAASTPTPMPANTPEATSTSQVPTYTAVPPTSTPGPRPATAAEIDLIKQAVMAPPGLKSFHFTQAISGSTMPQPLNIEGDYVAPDELYAKGQMSGEQGEFLKAGTQHYKKDAQGNWAPWTDPNESKPRAPQETLSSFFGAMGQFASASDFRNTGEAVTLDGVSTQHFVGTIATSKMPGAGAQVAGMQGLPPSGTIALWIDPLTKNLHKLEIHIDTGPAMAAVTVRLATPGAPTALPATPIVLAATVTVSRQNDAAISVPAAPTAGVVQPTSTTTNALPTTAPTTAPTTGPALPHPITAAERDLISQAMTATANLKSFHFTQVIAGSTLTQPWNIEGDYVAPDQEYSKGQLSGRQGEFLTVGTHSYLKDGQGSWVPWTAPGQTTQQDPQEFTRAFFTGLAAIAGFGDFQNAGTVDILDGAATQHFAGTISITKMPGIGELIAALKGLPPAGTIDLWIDPQAKTLHKVQVRLDTGPALTAAQVAQTAHGAPTMVPLPPYVFNVDMTVTRQNDPSISVPSPSGGGRPQPTATQAGGTTAGPTPTNVTVPVTAGAGYDSPAKALALTGPTHVDLTLSSAKDVVYFSFKTTEPIASNVWVYSPIDAVGKIEVQILDAGDLKEVNKATLSPDEQHNMSDLLTDPGLYLIKVTAMGLTAVPKTPMQIEFHLEALPGGLPAALGTRQRLGNANPGTLRSSGNGHLRG